MLKTKTTKVVTTLLALALVLSATVVSADTLSSTTFNTNLTVGSRGADVSALQTILISKGLLTAVSAPTGYFGNATKAALAAYQTSEGITPAVGYFGAITRAKINLTSGTATGPATSASCPAGYTCTATTGTISTSTGTVATGGEGTLDVKISAAPASNGNIQTSTDVPVWGVTVKAHGSQVTVQRADIAVSVKNLTSNSIENPGNFINTIKIWDASTNSVLATIPVNLTSFIQDSNTNAYHVILTGFNFVVPQEVEKTLVISLSTNPGIDASRQVTVSGFGGTGLRAIDGNGLNNYYDISGFSRQDTFKKPGLVTFTLSADPYLQRAQNYRLDPTNGVTDATLLTFNVKADNADALLKTVNVNLAASGTAPSILKLYDGSTLLNSVSASTSTVNAFTNLTLTIPAGTTKTLTIKADVTSGAVNGSAASSTVASVLYQSADGSQSTVSTAVVGQYQYFFNANPKFAISGSPAFTVVSNQNGSTTSATASFTFNVTSVGATTAQFTGPEFSIIASTSTGSIVLTGASATTIPNNNIADGATAAVTVTVPVSSLPQSGLYTVSINGIKWTTNGVQINQTWGLEDYKTSTALNYIK